MVIRMKTLNFSYSTYVCVRVREQYTINFKSIDIHMRSTRNATSVA